MKTKLSICLLALTAILTLRHDSFGQEKNSAAKPIEKDEKSAWHGFDRYDFVMDDQTLAIKTFKAPTDEKNSVAAPPKYGENPVLRSLMTKKPPIDNLGPLAKAGVPLLHVCGSLDPWLKDQTRVVEKRYQELGGRITVIVREGEGHFLLAAKDQGPIVDFILSQGLSKDTGPR